MSVNLSSYIDYSEWSNDWKSFIEFFLRVEGIKSKDGLWTKMDSLIREYDPLLWGSYRKGDMSDISYEEHNFQLAYLLRYYALYSKTIEHIATRSNFLEEILSRSQGKYKPNVEESFSDQYYVSIFGGGSAPEALSIIRSIANGNLINEDIGLPSSDVFERKKFGIYFSVFDKHRWDTGRSFTKHFIKREIDRHNQGQNFLHAFFNEKQFNIESIDNLSFKHQQDLIIFQFSLTEFRDLIGDQSLLEKIHKISNNLSPSGKLLLIERNHNSTPWSFFETFEKLTNFNLQANDQINHEAQSLNEIPRFIKKIYQREGRHASRYNKFVFYLYGHEKTNFENEPKEREDKYPYRKFF